MCRLHWALLAIFLLLALPSPAHAWPGGPQGFEWMLAFFAVVIAAMLFIILVAAAVGGSRAGSLGPAFLAMLCGFGAGVVVTVLLAIGVSMIIGFLSPALALAGEFGTPVVGALAAFATARWVGERLRPEERRVRGSNPFREHRL